MAALQPVFKSTYKQAVDQAWASAMKLALAGNQRELQTTYAKYKKEFESHIRRMSEYCDQMAQKASKDDFRFVDSMDIAHLESYTLSYFEYAGKALAFYAALHAKEVLGGWSEAKSWFKGIEQLVSKKKGSTSDSNTAASLRKLASDHPEFRSLLIPLLKGCNDA